MSLVSKYGTNLMEVLSNAITVEYWGSKYNSNNANYLIKKRAV